jgi:hypothetical protein
MVWIMSSVGFISKITVNSVNIFNDSDPMNNNFKE